MHKIYIEVFLFLSFSFLMNHQESLKYNHWYKAKDKNIRSLLLNTEEFHGLHEAHTIDDSNETENGLLVVDGDMLLTKEQMRMIKNDDSHTNQKQSALPAQTFANPWPEGKLYFKFNTDVPEHIKERILDAMGKWEAQTPITFINIDEHPGVPSTHYVLFNYSGVGGGCNAQVGMVNNKPGVNITNANISEGCNTGQVVHEIGHLLGNVH